MKYSPGQIAHHKALESLRHPKNSKTGLQLWRHLRRAELALSAVALAYCNGDATIDDWDKAKVRAEESVIRALGHAPSGLKFNSDARGYAIKIDGRENIPAGMDRDWGGYGILAPIIS